MKRIKTVEISADFRFFGLEPVINALVEDKEVYVINLGKNVIRKINKITVSELIEAYKYGLENKNTISFYWQEEVEEKEEETNETN